MDNARRTARTRTATARATCALALALALVGAPRPAAAQNTAATPAMTALKPFGPGQSSLWLDDETVPGGKLLLLDVNEQAKRPWDAGYFVLVPLAIQAGDRIEATLWVKPIEPLNEARLTAVIEASAPPRAELARQNLVATGGWQQHKVEFRATQAFKPYALKLTTHVGAARQAVAFGPVSFARLGP